MAGRERTGALGNVQGWTPSKRTGALRRVHGCTTSRRTGAPRQVHGWTSPSARVHFAYRIQHPEFVVLSAVKVLRLHFQADFRARKTVSSPSMVTNLQKTRQFRPKRNRPKKRFSDFDTPSKCVSPNVFRAFVKSTAQKTGEVQFCVVCVDKLFTIRPPRGYT